MIKKIRNFIDYRIIISIVVFFVSLFSVLYFHNQYMKEIIVTATEHPRPSIFLSNFKAKHLFPIAYKPRTWTLTEKEKRDYEARDKLKYPYNSSFINFLDSNLPLIIIVCFISGMFFIKKYQ